MNPAPSPDTKAELTRTIANLDAKIARLKTLQRRCEEELNEMIGQTERQARTERASYAARARVANPPAGPLSSTF